MGNVIYSEEYKGRKIEITFGYHGTMYGIYVDGVCFGGNLYKKLAIVQAKHIID